MRLPAVVALALVLPSFAVLGAGLTEAPPDAGNAAVLTAYLDALAEAHAFSGAVRLERAGQVLLRTARGFAEAEHRVANTPETRFRIGSLTKPFTAAAVLVLVQEGKLRLEDSVCAFVKDCPAAWRPVTLHHLLSHTSGIPNLFGEVEEAPLLETRAAVDQAIAAHGQGAVDAAPGERYGYSNFNYVLLGYVMEASTGSDWQSVLRRTVLAPLRLADTFYDDVWAIVPRRAHPYRREDGVLRNVAYDDHSAYAAGGLLSTVDDVAAFLRGLLQGRLVREPLLGRMLSEVAGGYGYGMSVTPRLGRPARDHYGGLDGFTSYMLELPGDEIQVVVLSNVENESARAVGCDLAALALGLPVVPLTGLGSYRPSEAELERQAGRYEGDPPRLIERSGAGLRYRRGETNLRLLPLAAGEWTFEGETDYRLHFVLPASGPATELRVTQCGSERFAAPRAADPPATTKP